MARLANDPPSTVTPRPPLSAPFFVVSTSAPPNVFSPNNGFDPGRTSTAEIAFIGIRSQLTIEPNGSFIRTPSSQTESPVGDPSSEVA